jgi:hypothetical protein
VCYTLRVQKLYLIGADFDWDSLVRLVGGFAPKGTHDMVVHAGELTLGRSDPRQWRTHSVSFCYESIGIGCCNMSNKTSNDSSMIAVDLIVRD